LRKKQEHTYKKEVEVREKAGGGERKGGTIAERSHKKKGGPREEGERGNRAVYVGWKKSRKELVENQGWAKDKVHLGEKIRIGRGEKRKAKGEGRREGKRKKGRR